MSPLTLMPSVVAQVLVQRQHHHERALQADKGIIKIYLYKYIHIYIYQDRTNHNCVVTPTIFTSLPLSHLQPLFALYVFFLLNRHVPFTSVLDMTELDSQRGAIRLEKYISGAKRTVTLHHRARLAHKVAG